MMALRLIELDRVTTVAPLGLQFHDAATGTIVGEGLSAWAFPAGRPAAKRPLVALGPPYDMLGRVIWDGNV